MENEQTAGVRVPPPVVYAACILIGVGLEYQWPVSVLPSTIRYFVGFGVILLSFVLSL